jgi:hypothetical protein
LSLAELPLRLPPLFAEACGYKGTARFVALCWIPELRELWLSDDGTARVGHADPFLILCDHAATGDALEEYRRLATGQGLRPWLLVDRNRRTLSMGNPGAVWNVTESQFDGEQRERQSGGNVRPRPELVRAVRAWLDWMGKRRGRT